MSKTNKKSINLSLKILALFAFALIFVPLNEAAAANGWTTSGNGIWTTSNNYYNEGPADQPNNPSPTIGSIYPKSSNVGVGTKTITITGSGFFPGSIVRINGNGRAVTFIDASHLLIQITGNDTYLYRANGGFFITVFNGEPGGGYSNAIFFTVNNPAPVPVVNNNGGNYTNYTNTNTNTNTSTNNTVTPDNFTDTNANQTNTGTTNSATDNYSNLASNAIFGSDNSFLPSGIVQWVLFAIIILLIVIVVRKVFGAKQNYEESPMKHA
jgi:hypothetical protein